MINQHLRPERGNQHIAQDNALGINNQHLRPEGAKALYSTCTDFSDSLNLLKKVGFTSAIQVIQKNIK
ncbi:MAG: hypothetical protein KBT40_01595 [bacterium]|nr:hypothetical protein [Candidatus Minthenecus merdequi]